jgi:hypothetical protein
MNCTDLEWSEIKRSISYMSLNGYSYSDSYLSVMTQKEFSSLTDGERIEVSQAWLYPNNEEEFTK